MSSDFLTQDELDRLDLAQCGRNVRVSRHALLLSNDISLGDNVRIDAFTILSAATVVLGSHVHVSAFVAIIGAAPVTIGDFVGISVRSMLLSSSDDFSGMALTGPTVPERYRRVELGEINVGRHALVGAGSIVLPGVTIGASSAVGAASLVKRDVAPFEIVGGVPARHLGVRARDHLALEISLAESDEA